MKILLIGDFQNDSARFIVNNTRKLCKGFIRNGHDVLSFSYREVLGQFSPVRGKKLSLMLAKGKTDALLGRLAKQHQSELVLVTAFKLLDEVTLACLKEALPRAIFACWYGDQRKGIDERVGKWASFFDWFLATGAGEQLVRYHESGFSHCAFLPNPCDPDVEHPYKAPARWKSELLFIGKLNHALEGQDPERNALIKYLADHHNLTTWGCLGKPTVDGIEAFYAISGCDTALSINAFNNVRLYHSDRLTRLLACGAFVLAKQVPDSNLLFEDGRHLCYFDTREQCVELIRRFGQDTQERSRIAAAGMEHTHRQFNSQRLAGDIIDLIETGECDESWSEVI